MDEQTDRQTDEQTNKQGQVLPPQSPGCRKAWRENATKFKRQEKKCSELPEIIEEDPEET